MNNEQNKHDRLLCFSIGNEECAIPLLSVKEVLALPEVTPVPQTPNYFLGIINLRGQVISIMDLRLKLSIKPKEQTENVVVICQVGEYAIGVLVDSVNSVLTPDAEHVAEKPEIQSCKSSEYIISIYKKDSILVFLIDLARALSLQDKNLIDQQNRKTA
jgi:purine-binding chemotaxis protein CheW